MAALAVVYLGPGVMGSVWVVCGWCVGDVSGVMGRRPGVMGAAGGTRSGVEKHRVWGISTPPELAMRGGTPAARWIFIYRLLPWRPGAVLHKTNN